MGCCPVAPAAVSAAAYSMKYDLLSAFRYIKTHPWFSFSVVLTIALGIGINTSVFTFTNAVLFKPVPVENGDRLVSVRSVDTSSVEPRSMNVSYLDFLELQAQNESFESLEMVNGWNTVLSDEGNPPEQFYVIKVSPGLFGMIGERPILGNGFQVDDGAFTSPGEVIIGYSVWQNRYGADPEVIGRSVQVGGSSAVIVGVMREGFRFPVDSDIWIPFVAVDAFHDRNNRWIEAYGILKRGVSIDDAAGELAVVARRIASEFPDTNADISAEVLTFHERFNGNEIRAIFLIMMGAVGFVMLIACANVANLMLGNALSRQSEMSIRASLGANRWQLVKQMLWESVCLSTMGGLLGLLLTATIVDYFDEATREVRPYWIEFALDYRVLFYFGAITIGSGLVFGLVPALRSSRVDLSGTMKEGSRASGSRSKGKLTGALIVLQFAMTMALLTGAGMMVRAYFYQSNQNSFLPAEELLTGRFDLPKDEGERYEDWSVRLQFYEGALERLSAMSSVRQAALVAHLPGNGYNGKAVEIDGRPSVNEKEAPQVSYVVQSESYLQAIGLGLREGRGFQRSDDETGPKVAIASREFVELHWPGESGLGKRFRFLDEEGDAVWRTIVGIAEELKQARGGDEAQPLVHLPLRQMERSRMYMVLRTEGDPLRLAHPAKEVVEGLDSLLPLYAVKTMQQVIDRNVWMIQVFGTLFLSFAGIGLFMASMGVYAVVAQSTNRRRREIGIRMALGAQRLAVQWQVVGRGIRQMGLGLAVGLVLSVGVSYLMSKGFLDETAPWDPLVLGGVSLVLVLVGVVACWIPARRGARLDPVVALRAD